MLDYLIVGCGLAGIALAESAIQNGKSVMVFDADIHNASSSAAGIFNPVILKRFSGLQDAAGQLAAMHRLYDVLEHRFQTCLRFNLPIYRKFSSVQEQNAWFSAADKPGLFRYLSTDIITDAVPGVEAPFGFGKVNSAGYIDIALLLKSYKAFLIDRGALRNDRINHNSLKIGKNIVTYKDVTARHVIFAEGFYLQDNPLFNYLPLPGTKGETLTLKAIGLPDYAILKAGIFILPLGNKLYKVGATYEWTDKTWDITKSARDELVQKLNETLNVKYEIIGQMAGIRPTVPDRKPLVGTHPDYQNAHILNGLGTRGVMLGPFMARMLLASIENGAVLDKSVDIRRFTR